MRKFFLLSKMYFNIPLDRMKMKLVFFTALFSFFYIFLRRMNEKIDGKFCEAAKRAFSDTIEKGKI